MGKLATTAGLALALFGAAADRPGTPDYAYVAAPQYDSAAWRSGRERFPAGAAVMLVTAQGQRKLAADFYASTDPAIFFDGPRILFAAAPFLPNALISSRNSQASTVQPGVSALG